VFSRPVKKNATTTSSKDSVKARSAAAVIAGASSGRVIV